MKRAKQTRENLQNRLPRHRIRTLNEAVSNYNILKIILLGLSSYCLVVIIITIVEFIFKTPDNFIGNKCASNNIFNLLYFNFITILTIGYGDYAPVGTLFRILSVIEALIGVALFGVIASILMIKAIQPNKNTIIFSKYGYYSLDDQRFMIIYLNTSKDYINNLQTCWYVKTGNDWGVSSAIVAPFITRAVQTFFLDLVPIEMLKQKYDTRDCLRVGLSGNLGVTTYSTSIEYFFDKIIVIQNRNYLTNYEGFWKVDEYLKKDRSAFESHFNYRPDQAPTLQDYIK